ncbi:TetR family transcriptional regulator [Mesohalobacter halotolerans]|jgi:AcrR family transcriptional regulator|uniref:Helix-turn-helix transcriptional regulator n=1 Tax=Mesohalobacter halotolerans TaxID=1883405 RepID=A0A4U5TQG4_9FLAO|nr:TetR family transcriptional regulator [Mesohalobacter halotolerans]MBS3739664.1 TetR family transcriptional regulator [Psychroflexus sp.]NBC57497.1 TetR family transcriptional regulator [Bacteroidota bacterium]TKS55971.1 helix-turn-helix transcriptional regulator [Mesohalobacter halotolerans]
MESLLSSLKLNISSCLYLKDPESSELGHKILSKSIEMIHELGIESFNFKKLGQQIDSNESSIYRYFENKYRLLQYLSAMYWGIIEYRLVIETNAIEDCSKKLLMAIKILTLKPKGIDSYSDFDQLKLRDIIIEEFTKSYHHKDIDSDNEDGNFKIYKRLILRIVEMINNVDPSYNFPKALACHIVEGALQQYYIQRHFKSLTDRKAETQVYKFYKDMILKVLNPKH